MKERKTDESKSILKKESSADNFIFKKGLYKITQGFGANSSYYSKFGLKGHEGIDLIPTTDDLTIYSPWNGVVWYVQPKDKSAYGKHVCVYYQEKDLMVYFCHMKKTMVKNGEYLKAGAPMGIMGNTGNSMGAHLHLMGYEILTKENPNKRKNFDNGYKGMIDLKIPS
jgi:murein DD-endopeptidase MepM/ murein hydrolase activator NlpD